MEGTRRGEAPLLRPHRSGRRAVWTHPWRPPAMPGASGGLPGPMVAIPTRRGPSAGPGQVGCLTGPQSALAQCTALRGRMCDLGTRPVPPTSVAAHAGRSAPGPRGAPLAHPRALGQSRDNGAGVPWLHAPAPATRRPPRQPRGNLPRGCSGRAGGTGDAEPDRVRVAGGARGVPRGSLRARSGPGGAPEPGSGVPPLTLHVPNRDL